MPGVRWVMVPEGALLALLPTLLFAFPLGLAVEEPPPSVEVGLTRF